MKNKIRVLLIDDYPSFALTKAGHTTLENIGDNQKELDIPFITSKVDTTGIFDDVDLNSMSPINVSIRSVVEEEYSEYFELKWLRNKEDLQLYKKLCRIVEDQFSSSALGRIDGVVPEIVLFDYALTGHEDKSYLNETRDMNLLAQVVPTYRIRTFLQNEKIEIPTADNISLDVSLIAEGLNSDNIGCMGGIMTVSHFRNHLCVGLATSRKSDEHIQGQDVQFLESLVKEPYQFNFSLRGNIKNLTWKTLLTNSAQLLRNRIKTLVQSNKITLDLTQLLEYAGGDIKPEQEKRIFTFQSAYGVRHLPLDGLFIDKTNNTLSELPSDLIEFIETQKQTLETLNKDVQLIDSKLVKAQVKNNAKETEKLNRQKEENALRIREMTKAIFALENITERDLEVWRFSNELLKILSNASGIETNTITKAKRIAEDLWAAATGDVLRERFKLSELFAKKHLQKQQLSADDYTTFENLCGADHFLVTNCEEIEKEIIEEKKLTNHINKGVFSIREHHKSDEKENKEKIVLATLFLTLRLEHQFRTFRKNNEINHKANKLSHDFTLKPTLKELLYVLFPSPRIPILMPGHLHFAPETFIRKILDDQYQKFFRVKDTAGIGWTTIPKDLDFTGIVTYGEKVICRAYATTIGMEQGDYPQWLR